MRTMLFKNPSEMIMLAKHIIGKWYLEEKKHKRMSDLSLALTCKKTFSPDKRYLAKLSRLPANGTRRDSYVKAAKTLKFTMMILQEEKIQHNIWLFSRENAQ